MSLNAEELKQLTAHVQATKKALQKLPKSEVMTDALATMDDVAEFATSPYTDPLPLLSAVSKAADDLTTFAVAQRGRTSLGEIDEVIKQLGCIAVLLRAANER
jgi:hypothetical protein